MRNVRNHFKEKALLYNANGYLNYSLLRYYLNIQSIGRSIIFFCLKFLKVSLVVQWIRLPFPMQEMWVPSLVTEL